MCPGVGVGLADGIIEGTAEGGRLLGVGIKDGSGISLNGAEEDGT